MAEEIQTMAIPVMLQEAQDTGLITPESLEALEAKRLQAQEKIENLNRMYRENRIAEEYLKAETKKIQKEIQDMTNAFDGDTEILS
jgi:hypothetical protein